MLAANFCGGRRHAAKHLAWLSALAAAGLARAGGTPENVLLIIDPKRPDAQYIGNYYKHARNIPDQNVLYMDSGAVSFASLVSNNFQALFGHIANGRLEDHVDYIVIAPPSLYRIAAPNLVSDGCFPVQRFSITGAYTMAFVADEVLSATLTSQAQQGYYRPGDGIRAFDSNLYWWNGLPRDPSDPNGRRWFIGALLGWTGVNGLTVDEIIEMIDRSVAVDGTRPAGTFYFMETTDSARSDPRDGAFDAAVATIEADGGQAEHLLAVLPTGHHDCLGIMTGWASPGIDAADMTILPGAFCDHLTSFAGAFDEASQEKMSRWIVKGASGSWGTIEEPCNYAGKFPHARVHVYSYRGLSLGESAFRSVRYYPFQGLLMGDPLTRPFAYLPQVDVPDAPGGTVSGSIVLTPEATTGSPTAAIAGYDLLIDGVLHASVGVGQAFTIDTTSLADGYHDVRVLAYDDSLAKSTGRWVGALDVDNTGRSATLSVTPTAGDRSTAFQCDIVAIGSDVSEVRLMQNGRVLAAAAGSSASLTVYGLTMGAGPVTLQAEALIPGGKVIRSAPQQIDVANSDGTPSGSPPASFSYTKRIRFDSPALVELPATFDDAATPLTFTMIQNPSQATLAGELIGPYRLVQPNATASGTDQMRFRVDSAAGSSAVATVTLLYTPCTGDLDDDGAVTLADLSALLTNFGVAAGASRADGDLDADGDVDLADLSALLTAFGTVCP
ncbi:MAG: hypothetical protein HRF50_12980 [Phycisphaerae bacterium]|jgi:hypothetical protein